MMQPHGSPGVQPGGKRHRPYGVTQKRGDCEEAGVGTGGSGGGEGSHRCTACAATKMARSIRAPAPITPNMTKRVASDELRKKKNARKVNARTIRAAIPSGLFAASSMIFGAFLKNSSTGHYLYHRLAPLVYSLIVPHPVLGTEGGYQGSAPHRLSTLTPRCDRLSWSRRGPGSGGDRDIAP
jgi:hypothetical protein